MLNLAHTLGDVREGMRRVNANRLNGVDAEWLDPDEVREFCPIVNTSPDAALPGARRDAAARAAASRATTHVVFGLAPRRATRSACDLLQGCEVDRRSSVDGGRVVGVETDPRADPRRPRGARVRPATRRCSRRLAGLELPLQSHPLQALVSELLEQVLPCVVMSNAVHVYVSQAHKGELVMGAGVDSYNSYAQRGSFHVIEHQMAAALELFPIFAGARTCCAPGPGSSTSRPDASPIIGPDAGRGPVRQLRLGHRRLQGHARRRAGSTRTRSRHGEPHALNAPFALERFETGALIDEHGAAAVAH